LQYKLQIKQNYTSIFGNDKTQNYFNQARRTKCRPFDDIDNDKMHTQYFTQYATVCGKKYRRTIYIDGSQKKL